MNRIKTFGIIPNESKDEDFACTRLMIHKLRSYGANCLIPKYCKEYEGAQSLDISEIYKNAECLIILGGDGTILRHSSQAAENGIAILGVNIGTVGFMCEIRPQEIDMLEKLVNGDYSIEKRCMLDVEVCRNDKKIASFTALNDAVIENEGRSKIIQIDFYRDGKFINKYRANGLIISTPTGSTAYAFSAGGPVIDPEISATCVCPICSQTITAKPMIFDMNSCLSARVTHVRDSNPCINVDGKEIFSLAEGDIINVRKSKQITKLVKLKSQSFYDNVYKKISIMV